MSCETASNFQRQEDEVAALSSIYDETEFFYTKSEYIKCSITVYPKFSKKLEIKFDSPSDVAVSDDSIFVEHLPPIRMYINLPNTYPSQKPPNFCISVVWLTPWDISFICQKLDEMWEENRGLNCIELENCKHIYCKSCMEKHIRINIIERINAILCPTIDCKRKISGNDVKTLCPDLFFQYEEIMLRVTLDTMDDVVYCPKISCQYPVIRNPGDDAPICPICKYCFCVYCRKSYHGQEPCEMTSTDIIKLIDEYKNSNIKQQAMLEKKYGKRQMQTIQKYLTTEYLQDNAKRCPKCRSFISKTEGCNKMTCRNCQSFFCWLCNNQIHGYEHFNSVDSPCYGLLFEGLETENAMDYENAVDNFIMDNINQYLENFNV